MNKLALIVLLAATVGCSTQPLTPVQKEQRARQAAKQGVLYCEVFAGQRTCKRVSHGDLGQILKGY